MDIKHSLTTVKHISKFYKENLYQYYCLLSKDSMLIVLCNINHLIFKYFHVNNNFQENTAGFLSLK